MSAKGLSGRTGFIPKYITIHRLSTKCKIRFFFHLKPNHKPTLCLKHEEINARKRGIWGMNVLNSAITKIFVAVLKREYRRLFEIVNLEFSVRCRFSFARYIHLNALFLTESKTSLCSVTACEEYIFDTQKINDKLHLNHILNRNATCLYVKK